MEVKDREKLFNDNRKEMVIFFSKLIQGFLDIERDENVAILTKN